MRSLIVCLSIFFCLSICFTQKQAQAASRYGELPLVPTLTHELNQVLKVGDSLHKSLVAQNEEQIEIGLRDLILQIDRARSFATLAKLHERGHLILILDAAREQFELTQTSYGDERRKRLEDGFNQLVNLVRIYRLDRTYAIYFCPKDKTTWVQKGEPRTEPVQSRVVARALRHARSELRKAFVDQFIQSLPRPVLAIGVIIVGFMFIVMNDPPKTVCDSQIELFREAQQPVIYGGAGAAGAAKPAVINELHDHCQSDNGPGACFEYFERLKKLVVDLDNIPTHCADTAAKEAEIQSSVFKALKLMSMITWGDRGPASLSRKHAWFDASDIALFCDLRRSATRIYGNETFAQWRESILASLPGAEQMSREQLWQKSAFSTSCDAYR